MLWSSGMRWYCSHAHETPGRGWGVGQLGTAASSITACVLAGEKPGSEQPFSTQEVRTQHGAGKSYQPEKRTEIMNGSLKVSTRK